MQSIKETLTKRPEPTSKANSERAAMIEYFVTPLMEERREANIERFKKWMVNNKNKSSEDFKKSKEYLRPMRVARIAMMMSHIPTEDLHPFFKQCLAYKGGFSRAWWGALKVNK